MLNKVWDEIADTSPNFNGCTVQVCEIISNFILGWSPIRCLITGTCGAWWRHQMETFSASLAICAGIHRSLMNSAHRGQWSGALMFSLIYACINVWINNREADDLRRHGTHYDATVMSHNAARHRPFLMTSPISKQLPWATFSPEQNYHNFVDSAFKYIFPDWII